MKIIDDCIKNNWKICIYGLGNIGRNYSQEFCEYLGITPGYVCDGNRDVIEKYHNEFLKKKTCEELLSETRDFLVLIMVGAQFDQEIVDILSKNPYLHILTWKQICEDEDVLKKYYGFDSFNKYRENKHIENHEKRISTEQFVSDKIALYTCITGNYDGLEIPSYIDSKCDYFVITDIPDNTSIINEEYYTRINIYTVLPNYVSNDPKEQNRYCKMHGYELFPEYRYSIYYDGNVDVIGSVSDYIYLIGNSGLAIRKHHFASNPYSEIMRVMVQGVISREESLEVGKWLHDNGMPLYDNHYHCSVIVSDHSSFVAREILENWFELYRNGKVKRDQFYFAYVLWKMGIKKSDMGIILDTIQEDKYFNCSRKHK